MQLQKKASGVFIWIVLVVKMLNKAYDGGRIHALEQILQDIPDDLHKLFHNILIRDNCNIDELCLCLQWVLFSPQRLTLEELYFAIISNTQSEAVSKWDFKEVTDEDMKRYIIECSKGLIKITEYDSVRFKYHSVRFKYHSVQFKCYSVQFIHESVKDYLLKEDGLSKVWPGPGSNFQGPSHEKLKQFCINFIHKYPILYPPRQTSKEASSNKTVTPPTLFPRVFPFLEYAVNNVLYYADMAQGWGICQKDFIENFPLRRWIQLYNMFSKTREQRYIPGATLLYILAKSNMSKLIEIISPLDSFLKIENQRYGSPLLAALANKNTEAIQAFLAVVAKEHSSNSQLHKLCQQYCPNQSTQETYFKDMGFKKGRSMLSYIVEHGETVLLDFLIEMGISALDEKDHDGRTPLIWAAIDGNMDIVKLLLETGKANLNSKDKNGQTPLSWAVIRGKKEVVQLLLERNADIELEDSFGRTPLSWAMSNGNKEVVQLLLETGKVNINSEDKNGQTPLSWAASNGTKEVAQLFLETGKFDINAKYKNWGMSLSWVATKDIKGKIQLLLEAGEVDINSKDKNGQKPLSWASIGGIEEAVQLLIERNADIR